MDKEKMGNLYLQNLNHVEFVVTFACTGRCKHCSEGERLSCGEHIDGDTAAKAVREIAGEYAIKSVMTFGGEPLLHSGDVCKILSAARDTGIENRQIITNGYFTRVDAEIERVAQQLVDSGANNILLSADAFHQEIIPIEYVIKFAKALLERNIPRLRVHPAWLVSSEASNPYNDKTRELLKAFVEMGIEESNGNVIFPAGNALKYLSEYFDLSKPIKNPYEGDPYNVTAVSIAPNGDLFNGNIYINNIVEILRKYSPTV